MAKEKITRKELLKEPDEFLTTTGRVIAFFQDNPRVLALCITGIVAAVVIVLGYSWYRQSARLASHEMFERAYRGYSQAVHSPESVPAKRWDQILKLFDSVVDAYPSWPAGESALLYSGHVLYKKKDFEGALQRYNRMKSTELVRKGLGNLVMYHRAMTYMAMKDFQSAEKILQELSRNNRSPYRREAFASIARVYESQGKKKEAIQAYRQYLKMFPTAPDAALVKARIADLATQG